MPNSADPHNTPQHRIRKGCICAVALFVMGGSGWGIFSASAGDQSPKVKVEINDLCFAVNGDAPCTSSSGSPPPPAHGQGSGQGEPRVTPQLLPTSEVRAHALDRRDGPAIVRSAPSVDGRFLYELDPHSTVEITCQRWAEVVKPSDGSSTALWDQIGPNQWVNDAWVDTDSDRPVTRMCDHHPEQSQSDRNDASQQH